MKRRSNSPVAQQITIGTETIAYTLTRANRKSISITIRPNLSVDVRVPHRSQQAAIDEVLHKRAGWILRHLQKFAARPAPQPLSINVNNNSYLFLGHRLPLTVEMIGSRAKEIVLLEDGKLLLRVKHVEDQNRRIASLLDRWRREQAESHFQRRMLALFLPFKSQSLQLPILKIRNMRARWGSCSTNGTVTINLKLIHMDETLIDYVIMHEFCHLIEHNHSKHYYALLTRMMPDWRIRRKRLNELGMPQS